jgi:hypothetical protein
MNVVSYSDFRRRAVPPQVAQQLQTVTIPAPTRGLILNENESYMQPGGALVLDNWIPTMKGIKLRGGTKTWAVLSETTPVISMFTFISGTQQRLYAGNATKLYDVTATTPVMIKSGQTSGNYVASQLANQAGDHMLVANDAGDYLLHFDGTTWTTLNASQINTDPAITPPPTCAAGHNLTYVWKYRGRYFFIEGGTMNAWYLPTNAFQGRILQIPLAGAATKGGKLLCGFTWSIDAGDGIDDKCVFMTDQGELLIFTGSDPSTVANWRQEGRYATSTPLGMNCYQPIGGDVLIATVDGIIPISASITKDTSQLELAAITRAIKPMWRDEVNAKRALPWTMCKWDEVGVLFTTYPGGTPGNYTTGAVNIATGAWARVTGWDAMCFGRMRADMFFGTQAGKIIQAERTGTDDGSPYVASMVGGWEMFSSQSATIVWRQARASFRARSGEPFQPQLSATTDYVIVIPTPPSAATDPGPLDVWDQGLWGPSAWTPPVAWANSTAYAINDVRYDGATANYWKAAVAHTSAASGVFAADRAANPTYWTLVSPQPGPPAPSAPDQLAYAQWDQPAPSTATVRNTMWVSIGMTGFSHAPICQVTIAQQALPDVELISIAATYDAAGVNV